MPESAMDLLYEGARLDRRTYHAIYDQTQEDFRCELIGGVVCRRPRTTWKHGEVHAHLLYLFHHYAEATPGADSLAPVPVLLDDENEPEPDLSMRLYPEAGGRSAVTEDGYLAGPLELVLEIVDPHTRERDVVAKSRAYERAGTGEFVLLLPHEERALWFVTRAGRFVEQPIAPDDVWRSSAFPGLWIDLTALFAGELTRSMPTLAAGLGSPEHAAFVAELARRLSAANP